VLKLFGDCFGTGRGLFCFVVLRKASSGSGHSFCSSSVSYVAPVFLCWSPPLAIAFRRQARSRGGPLLGLPIDSSRLCLTVV